MTKIGLLLKYGLLKNKERSFQEMTPDFRNTCQRDYEWSYYLAVAFALFDEKKEALDWLENAVNRGLPHNPIEHLEKACFKFQIRYFLHE
jgi:hypothetical protein